ncbi:DUF2524 family protein [Bacillus sp. HMF5848]|uniref:DUF2524 family protein n=1 Tax=Bacillus sp. HMF5848 TaxID=2495421 RepID=UPI000F7AF048|nr:DUF2524 family protein [Bacillus sp. HMF5848]RSK28245.1 DUF2524 family protein [Bacillus sp. HMF5848]
MTTRDAMEGFLQQSEDTIRFAKKQLQGVQKQGHGNDQEFHSAVEQVEQQVQQLNALALSSNSDQRQTLDRMRLQLQQLQNDMILEKH